MPGRGVIESRHDHIIWGRANSSSTFGTLFVWFDTERISAAIQPHHMIIGNDPRWDKWYYNQSKPGFALLFAGILLQGLYVWLMS